MLFDFKEMVDEYDKSKLNESIERQSMLLGFSDNDDRV